MRKLAYAFSDQPVSFQNGEPLFQQGDPNADGTVYFVRSGAVGV